MIKKLVSILFLLPLLYACNEENEFEKTPIEKPKNNQTNLSVTNKADPNFTTNKPDTSVQISPYIRHIFEDSKGNLWFGTTNEGVAKYNGNTLAFAINDSIKNKTITGITEDKSGNIWISSTAGLFKYNGVIFKHYTTNEGLISNEVWSIFADTNGTIWIGTINGVCKFENEKFIPFPIPLPDIKNTSSRFGPKLVWCFLQDKNGNMWFGSDGYGVTKYDAHPNARLNDAVGQSSSGRGKTFTHFTTKNGLCNNNVTAMLEDKNGNMWFGTTDWNKFSQGGISCFNSKSFVNYSTKNGMTGNHVTGIYEMKNKELWFIIRANGIDKFVDNAFTNLNEKDGLVNKAIISILEDSKGTIWVGTGGGLYRYANENFINVTKNGPWK